MVIFGLFQWWYTRGWGIFLQKLRNRLKDAADFFSIRLLITNLFAPFRQISVGESMSPALSARLSAFFDRLLSRVIGTIVRLFLLIVGVIIIILQAIFGVFIIILWPLAPFAMIACLVLTITGVAF